MSWQDDIQNTFEIITGDGISYFPKWKNAKKVVDYNVSQFDFINVSGSLIDRRKHKARKFDLEFYFDGENAVTIGNNFEISARNTKRWNVKHPFYGNIICQPVSLDQDNTLYNVTKFMVQVMETLIEGFPKADPIISDKITELEEALSLIGVEVLNNDVIVKADLKEIVTSTDTIYSKWISSTSDLETFKRAVSSAVIAIDATIFDAVLAVRNVQAVINFPATVKQTVESRINVFVEALEMMLASFNGTFVNKFQIESLGNTYISGMLKSATTPIDGDYYTKAKVFSVQETLLNTYNDYLTEIDFLQTERADSKEGYTPDFDNMNTLDEMFSETLGNLYQIAFTAKQERSFITDKESNPIILSHRFYGLDPDDEKLIRFINENELTGYELLNIRKGRKVVYYA